jgi:ribosomal protein S18 acetylase RimI-like enzyme
MIDREQFQVTVREFIRKDADAVAWLHREGIVNGFLTRLGQPFLSSLYLAIAGDVRSVVYVAENKSDGSVIGFIAGTVNISAMYKRIIRRNGFRFALLLFPIVIRPDFLWKMIQTLFYATKKKKAEELIHKEISSELLSIAVSDFYRGKNVGKNLVEKLEEYYCSNNIKEYKVVTSAADQTANAFYKKIGFELLRQFRHHENVMNEYVARIKNR